MASKLGAMVKDLREKTGAGMMDCKKALTETNGDTEAAIDWLRKKGLSAAAKKSDRVAAEGLRRRRCRWPQGRRFEVNAETDFVARNDKFQKFALDAVSVALKSGADLEGLKIRHIPKPAAAFKKMRLAYRHRWRKHEPASFDRFVGFAGRRRQLCPQRGCFKTSVRSACSSRSNPPPIKAS